MTHPWEDEAGESCPVCDERPGRGRLCADHEAEAENYEPQDGDSGHKGDD